MTTQKVTYGMDAGAQQTFVRFFRNLPEKASSTIRFFNRVDYYTCHGSDATYVAKEFFKTTSVCKMIGAEGNKIEGVLLNKGQFEAFLKELLLVKKYRAEVYVQTGVGKNKTWNLQYKGSPGNLSQFEDILFGTDDNNPTATISGTTMAVVMGMDGKSKVVGLSCIDSISCVIRVAQFMDDEMFSNLEACVVTNATNECILIEGDKSQDFLNIQGVLQRNNISITLKKKKDFSKDSLIQDLNSLLKFKDGEKESAHIFPETQLEHAMTATAGLIKYLDLTSDEGNINQYKIEDLKQTNYMKLDSSVVRALNIDPSPEYKLGNNRGAPTSIFELLDKCRTPQGHRLLTLWIKQPLQDLSLITERLDIVEFFVNNSEIRSNVNGDYLKRIPDLEQLVKKILRKKAKLRDIYKVYECINNLPNLVECLSSSGAPAALKSMITESLKESMNDMEKYQEMVEKTIDFDSIETGEYLIKPDFTEELLELHKTMNSLKTKMENEFSKAAQDLSLDENKSIKLESMAQFGYYLRVTMKSEKMVRHNKTYKVFDASKNGVKFRTEKMEKYNEDYLEAKRKYEAAQRTIVTEVIDIAIGYCSHLKNIAKVAAILDVLTAFAVVAANGTKNYVRPKILEKNSGVINFKQARHPCIESQQDVNYIANDIEFKQNESEFHIITGPNMGGKSTHLKTAGIVVLLAHIGCYVPCDEATMPLIDSMFARVGADDSQFKGISTFMAEMIEMAYIMRTATSNSLILIDELGRGTSTYDGRGLAWAIAEHLAKHVRAFSFFATHFHEITMLAEDIPTVKNYHVTAMVNGKDVIFLYAVKPGISDQSFGINVARMVNLSEDIIDYATKKLKQLEEAEHLYEGYFEGPYTPEEKRRMVVEADKLIEKMIDKCSKLDQSLPEEELINKINEYKEEVLSQDNPYINTALLKVKN
ncbi:DNA mismatch repair protein Msh2 [Chelonus insularis]|uniref:DNA mismatch repair protein Msh2 n=1 Tax=Chelonus insularis TaxID=460826 RepID=UPI001588A236|nr:DNA mismatch repair protein Msh2 [Chelonus insularis]